MENQHLVHRNTIDVLDAIYSRHAVRNYQPKQVDEDIIHQLLEAANHAPSALHEDSRAFTIIQSRKLLDRISVSAKELTEKENTEADLQRKRVLQVVQQEEFNIFYNAPALIVICRRFDGPFVEADCWLAAENIMLAALSFGLASCVIGFSVGALNLPKWKQELGIPQDMAAVAPIILGWPAEHTLPAQHQAPNILKWLK